MDDLDKKILRALQKDGRRKNADLAREFDVAPSTMLERINRLKSKGQLRGYRAIVDPKALGLQIQGFVAVNLSQHVADKIRNFEYHVKSFSFVRACYHVSGGFDYILHVIAKDLEHIGRLVKEHIAALPGVGKTETFLVFSEIKSDQGCPIEIFDQKDGTLDGDDEKST